MTHWCSHVVQNIEEEFRARATNKDEVTTVILEEPTQREYEFYSCTRMTTANFGHLR
jgi:hypothetical protein